MIVENSEGSKSIFNTGLITPNGEDIYGYFEPNTPCQYIHLNF